MATAPPVTMNTLPLEILWAIVDMALPQDLWLEILPRHELVMATGRRPVAHFDQAARFAPWSDWERHVNGPAQRRAWQDVWRRFWEYNPQYADNIYWQALRDWYRTPIHVHNSAPAIDTDQAIMAISLTSRAMRQAVVNALSTRGIPVVVLSPGSPTIDTLVPLARDVARRSPTLILRYSWLESDKVGLERLINDMPYLQTVLLPGIKIQVDITSETFDTRRLYDGLVLRRRSAWDIVVDLLTPLMPERIYRRPEATPTTVFREVSIENLSDEPLADGDDSNDVDHSDDSRVKSNGLDVVLGRRLAGEDDVDPPVFIAIFRRFDLEEGQTYLWRAIRDVIIPEFRQQFGNYADRDPTSANEDAGDAPAPRSAAVLTSMGNAYDAWYLARPNRPSHRQLLMDSSVFVRYVTTSRYSDNDSTLPGPW